VAILPGLITPGNVSQRRERERRAREVQPTPHKLRQKSMR
jgi:hypothetical protein